MAKLKNRQPGQDAGSGIRGLASIGVFICLSLGLPPAARANLVQDPGFESSDLMNTVFSMPWAVSATTNVFPDISFPHTGSVDAIFVGASGGGSVPADNTLSQGLSTTAATAYLLSFWLLDEGTSAADTFTVSLGAFSHTIAGDPSLATYTQETFTVPAIAISGGDILSFLGLTDPNAPTAWNLDDISVTAISTKPVPEPFSVTIFATALGAIAFAKTRRRRPARG